MFVVVDKRLICIPSSIMRQIIEEEQLLRWPLADAKLNFQFFENERKTIIYMKAKYVIKRALAFNCELKYHTMQQCWVRVARARKPDPSEALFGKPEGTRARTFSNHTARSPPEPEVQARGYPTGFLYRKIAMKIENIFKNNFGFFQIFEKRQDM